MGQRDDGEDNLSGVQPSDSKNNGLFGWITLLGIPSTQTPFQVLDIVQEGGSTGIEPRSRSRRAYRQPRRSKSDQLSPTRALRKLLL